VKARAYITGASAISPQPTFDRDALEHVVAYTTHPLNVILPDIANFMDPVRARRMTRHTRMGLMAAINALQRAGVEQPGAIIVATGDGCKDSVARFLDNMVDHDEAVANPTAFIGSTHNSLAGQIAMALNSKAYNYTYLQRGASFPTALMDGLLKVREEGERNVVVGAADVVTPDFFRTHRRSWLWKQNDQVANLEVLTTTDRGALAGEGSAFFVLDSIPSTNAVELLGVDSLFCAKAEDMVGRAEGLLAEAGKRPEDVDLLIVGLNGDPAEDRAYDPIREHFPNATLACYKPLCGEFYTANALGLWFAWSALVSGKLPNEMVLKGRRSGGFKTALVHDHFQMKDHSLMLLGGS